MEKRRIGRIFLFSVGISCFTLVVGELMHRKSTGQFAALGFSALMAYALETAFIFSIILLGAYFSERNDRKK